jgi:NIPSNAP protein
MPPMLYELRQYRAQPGRRDDLARFMEDVIIPFQASKGMVIVASFVAEEEDDLYVWIRRFEDEADRVRLYAAVYEDERWKTEIAPRVGEMLDRPRMVITRLNPTPKSVLH